MSDFLNDILAGWRPQRAKTQSEAEREAGEEFTIDLMILRHEADALGIRPTTSEIASVVSKMRAFRGDGGGFDPKKYNDIVENALGGSHGRHPFAGLVQNKSCLRTVTVPCRHEYTNRQALAGRSTR